MKLLFLDKFLSELTIELGHREVWWPTSWGSRVASWSGAWRVWPVGAGRYRGDQMVPAVRRSLLCAPGVQEARSKCTSHRYSRILLIRKTNRGLVGFHHHFISARDVRVHGRSACMSVMQCVCARARASAPIATIQINTIKCISRITPLIYA